MGRKFIFRLFALILLRFLRGVLLEIQRHPDAAIELIVAPRLAE